MGYQIEIIEGTDPSSYFFFTPVAITSKYKITWDDINSTDDVFSIEEGDVDSFLYHFLLKYFDEELIYNKERFEGEYLSGFQWWLEHNFFTYTQLEAMCQDIEECAELLKSDFENSRLAGVKERFSIFYMCDSDDIDYKNGDTADEVIKRHVDVVIDFYNRFVIRLRKMMKDNPETNLISISGP